MSARHAARPLGQLRIIGGQWRSRRVNFDAAHGVRPTPDRVRQTVFDWLSPIIDGARCLDAFAGSGALGLEALSRGAAQVTFLDRGAAQIGDIQRALVQLAAQDRAEAVAVDSVQWLLQNLTRVQSSRSTAGTKATFDVVFIDPPYDAGLLLPCLNAVRPWLAPVHRIYIEWPASQAPEWPSDLHFLRQKSAGQVSYGLAEFAGAAP